MSSSFAFINNGKGSPKKEFKSSFDFIKPEQQKSRPTFNFSSSFIMEDLFTDEPPLSQSKSPKKPASKNYFSFIDDLEKDKNQDKKSTSKSVYKETQSQPTTLPRQSMAQSAFDFMNQDNKQTVFDYSPLSIYESDERSVASSSLSRSTIKQDNEVKYLHVQSTWNKIQQKKSTDLKRLENVYNKQAMVMDKIQSIREDVSSLQKAQEEAIVSENFQLAQQYSQQMDTLNKNLEFLLHDQLNDLTLELRSEWQRMIEVLEKEANSSKSVIQYGQLVHEERSQKLDKFVSDMNLIRDSKIQRIDKKREDLETAKSEIAFDHDMWTQNDTELNERKEEAIHDEMEKRNELSGRSEKIRSEIIELRAKLKALELQDKSIGKEIAEIDSTIKQKLQPFINEEQELQQEADLISKRQAEIEEETVMLDREDQDIQTDIRKQNEKQEQDKQELQALDDQIQSAIQREKANQSEIRSLKSTLQKVTQERDSIVAQHQQQIREFQDKIKRKSDEIKVMSQTLYHQENACINLEDFMTNISSKLVRLTKLKQLAVQNREFENAAQLSQEIKATELSLEEARSRKEAQSQLQDVKDRVAREKSNLEELKVQLATIRKQNVLSMEDALEKIKDQLVDIVTNETATDYSCFKAIVEFEIKSIEAQLNEIRQ